MEQYIMSGLGAIILLLFGFVLNSFNNTLTLLNAKVQALEILVAGDYVKRIEYKEDLDKIYNLLRKMEDKIK